MAKVHVVYFQSLSLREQTRDTLTHVNKFKVAQTVVRHVDFPKNHWNYPFPFSLNQRATEPILFNAVHVKYFRPNLAGKQKNGIKSKTEGRTRVSFYGTLIQVCVEKKKTLMKTFVLQIP